MGFPHVKFRNPTKKTAASRRFVSHGQAMGPGNGPLQARQRRLIYGCTKGYLRGNRRCTSVPIDICWRIYSELRYYDLRIYESRELVHSLHVQKIPGLNAQRLVSRHLQITQSTVWVSFCSQPGVELSVLLVSPSLTETSRGSACRGMSVSLKGQLNRNWPFVRSIFRCAWLYVAACLKHLETVDTYILWGRRGLGSAPSADARCCRAADMLGFANRTATLPVTWHHAVRKTSRNKQVASIVVTQAVAANYLR